ncbi:isochorismatase family cysteine hydrolase [Roseibium aggregatum]|uniref:Cysteine hydrolase n=1 Tax=Roseibium aggregatum TaxID=187304 RepID=A0A939EG65_9HYPH|nr:isochorismatase family cysteine hydrolase [Roseibium aggregatum]MBN9672631.1 cysteine hydrolase [Roseibium aggregatum]
MKTLLLTIAAGLPLMLASAVAPAAENPLPSFDKKHTAIVITDPQNDFLAPDGKLYGLVAENLAELGTVANIETLMKTAKSEGVALAVDPLVYTRVDIDWSGAGALQRQLLDMRALYRDSLANPEGFEGSGADFYAPYKPYIHDGETIVVAPHKMYGPESNDLIYQLRSRGIDTVILGGLVANLCVDSHMRALMENGFKVFVVKDAVGGPGSDAYNAALVNYSMIANGVLTTEDVTQALAR